MNYDFPRVMGAHDSVLDYADLLTTSLRNDDVQEIDTILVEFFFDDQDPT